MKISYINRILLQIKKIYINSTEKEKKKTEKHTEYNKIFFFVTKWKRNWQRKHIRNKLIKNPKNINPYQKTQTYNNKNTNIQQ
jgi:hypothetical protein